MYTKHAVYNETTNLQVVTDTIIRFGGSGDALNFVYSDGHDKVTAVGTNQTISFRKSLDIDVTDHGRGLTLSWNTGLAESGNFIVRDLQNDLTGKFHLGDSFPVTYAADKDGGGITASSWDTHVDFKGFHDIAALQAHFV